MTRVCEECGKEFEGTAQAHYCHECRRRIQRESAKEYYYRNRESIRKKQKAYQATLKKGPKTREKPQYETRSWTVEYIRKGDLWTWKAKKGNVVLEAHRNFYSLRTAQRDCLLAIG